ncbi:hypothetical protein FH972_000497 [Carpinus fangiana]|uniref:Uncharacterized protein n=1 Tax=Carpinus fangiana TaxID=176857 RepID=A0A5N6Q910_9ROSI|nr:hypothetical protein FH972_000497 [Carpinus fangiana]
MVAKTFVQQQQMGFESNHRELKEKKQEYGNNDVAIERRHNSYGKFLELSEYGGKGRRSFVIIPEGDDGKGWEDCRDQLRRLKTHFDKQRAVRPPVKQLEGQKGEAQTGKVLQESQWAQSKGSYTEVVMGKKTVKRGTIPTMVIEENPSQAAGELSADNQAAAVEEILLSLRMEVDSCLHKIEMGWKTWGERMQMGFATNAKMGFDIPATNKENGQKNIQPKLDPVENKAQPKNRFRKTYRRRRAPRRLLRWRVKEVGRENLRTPEKLPESNRSMPPEMDHGSNEPDQATQIIYVEKWTGNGVLQPVAKEKQTETLPESSRIVPPELELGLNGPKQAAQTICEERWVGDGLMQTAEENEMSSKALNSDQRPEMEEKSGLRQTETEVDDKQVGQEVERKAEQGSCALNWKMMALGVGEFPVMQTGSEDKGENLTGSPVFVTEGKSIRQDDEMDANRESFCAASQQAVEVCVPSTHSVTGMELIQFDDEEVVDCEPLDVQMGDTMKGEELNKKEACEWVVERMKDFCHVVGLSLEGHEEELMAMFRAIEADRNKKTSPFVVDVAVEHTTTISKSKRELQHLSCSINYDGKKGVATKAKGKGQGSTVV